jgi:hypothetical protein
MLRYCVKWTLSGGGIGLDFTERYGPLLTATFVTHLLLSHLLHPPISRMGYDLHE